MAMIELQVNGKAETVEGGTNLRQYLMEKGINPNLVACELNLDIVRRADLDKVVLKNGDTLEIIRIIGGG